MTDAADLGELATTVIAGWWPGARVSVLRDLRGGRSGALVLLVDVVPPSASGLRSGQYILKVSEQPQWPGEDPEPKRHTDIAAQNGQFAKRHIPTLIKSDSTGNRIATLYEVAGQSFSNVVTADTLDAAVLPLYCRDVSFALLHDLNDRYSVENGTARQTLNHWLGYRLRKAEAPILHDFVETHCGSSAIFARAGRVLVNPLWLATSDRLTTPSLSISFVGVLHGDLHPGNLLIDRRNLDNRDYWLIDLALSRNAPLALDNANLELSLLLAFLYGTPAERILSVLEALDAPEGSLQARRVPVSDIGIVEAIRSIRKGATEWQQLREPLRSDAFEAQVALAQVAASIIWLNKPLSEPERKLVLSYGGYCARRLLEKFEPKLWETITGDHQAPLENEKKTEQSRQGWSSVWEDLTRFDPLSASYVLVAASSAFTKEAESLAFLPWAAIVDLDPDSDKTGLFCHAAPMLSQLRSVTQFGRQSQPVDFERGTAWLMANGWTSRFESRPTTLREWRQIYSEHIRALSEILRRTLSPKSIKVVVLADSTLDVMQVQRTVELIDEGLKGSAEIVFIGAVQPADPSTLTARYDIHPSEFVREVSRVYGLRQQVDAPSLPGVAGPVVIPLDRLRNIEVDFEVLHSRVLAEEQSRASDTDQFWRGNPPTWRDLHAHLDVKRDITDKLLLEVRRLLGASRNETLELHHAPGSGGTTSALRAAWDLRLEHPVIVLRRLTSLTVDRVDQVFQLTQKPVLLVADASIMSPSAREDLFRGLVSRNSRVVILYVIRSLSIGSDNAFELSDPMSADETARFYEAFSRRTDNAARRARLAEISATNDKQLIRYRSPFFYGLITYEREFETLDRYVQTHLEGTSYPVQKALRYVALVTRFGQAGLSDGFIRQLLGLHRDSKIGIDEIVGAKVARLILTRYANVRLMHPVIAEEVLRELLGNLPGDNWKHGLKDVALDFIYDIVRILGNDADETSRVLEELFIRRDYWERAGARRNFAELIQEIPSAAGQHQVLQVLTEVCPREAHFWNHLGRHHIYEMKQDFAEAEVYLQRAVELDPEERVHHHSLGMVRRFWIRNILSKSRRADGIDRDALLKSITGLVDSGADAFAEARRLGPDDVHGYITHVQMVLEVAERLGQIGEKGSVLSAKGPTGEWMRKNVGVVEQLLDVVRQMRGHGAPSKYELKCEGDLASVYGDYDKLIGTWEGLLGEVNDPHLRRALAGVYYARRGRVWASLDPDDLRRVVSLMESNLSVDPTNEVDIRTWFQAYRRLPEFSYLEAFDRLNSWASRSGSVDAYYYLYILHYLRWRDGVERDETNIEAALSQCRERARGRRGTSYEWLGLKPEWCPLVQAGQLGKWDPDLDFFENGDLLQRVEGIVESIKGPQSGVIRLGDGLRAFFVPGRRVWQSADINALVTFRLGFSYEGFRAWSVELVRTSTRTSQEPESHVPESFHEVRTAAVTFGTMRNRVRTFVADLVVAAANVGNEITVADVGHRLRSEFPGEPVHSRLGYEKLTDLVRSLPGIALVSRGSTQIVRLTDRDEGVTDVPRRSRVEPLARAIIAILEATPNRTIDVAELLARLASKLPSDATVRQHLNAEALSQYVREIPGLTVSGKGVSARISSRSHPDKL